MISDLGLMAFAHNCHQLRSLSFSSCKLITNRTMEAIGSECPDLRHLNLNETSPLIKDSGILAVF